MTWPSQVPSCSRSTKPPLRPASRSGGRGPGSASSRCSVKPGSLSVGKCSSAAEVDHEVDRLVVGPDVGAAVDAGLDDRRGRGSGVRSPGGSVLSRPVAADLGSLAGRALAGQTSAQVAGPTSPAAMSRAIWRRSACASASSAASSSETRAARGTSMRVVQVVRRSGRQHVEHDAAGEQRGRSLDLVGVGDELSGIEDRDRAPAGHPEDLVARPRR